MLLLGRTALLGLAIPFLAILLAYLLAARSGRAAMRSLWMELAGAAGLALTAPAAYIAASGQLTSVALALWALLALQNAMGVLYVRLRLADSKQRAANRSLTLWGHVAAFAVVLASGVLGWTPLLAAVPFAGFLVRALWAVRQPRPVPNIKRFGFTEVARRAAGRCADCGRLPALSATRLHLTRISSRSDPCIRAIREQEQLVFAMTAHRSLTLTLDARPRPSTACCCRPTASPTGGPTSRRWTS